MIDDTYGKMPETGAEKQVIMEYEYMMMNIAKSTTWNETAVDAELGAAMINWMETTPNLSYHVAG